MLPATSELRSKAKAFYNALDSDRPINFGLDELISNEDAEPVAAYVDGIHGVVLGSDLIMELADQIDFSLSAGAYLFTGNRGTGKTTELMRLATNLENLGCEVFYVDLSQYLSLTQPIEITDFLISVLGALSEKVSARFGVEVGGAGFFARAWSFLQSKVEFEEVSLPAGPTELQGALVHAPAVKEELQRRSRAHAHALLEHAREFVLEVASLVRERRADRDMKVILIVDSIERLRGVGRTNEIHALLRSAERLFSSDADSLRFSGMSVIYTIPPWLPTLASPLGSFYAAAASTHCRAFAHTSRKRDWTT
ncbi:MAG: hypothetical protein HC927_10480 [Deltaproteobacteria bacterium]|nr:hypothetical protein [Deltaproteobacteria bacterium]